MDNQEHDRLVNELLDASLARYSSPEPRHGLDGRVLARVRAAESNRRWFAWTKGVAAGAVAAGIALCLFSVVHRRSRTGNIPAATRPATRLLTATLPPHDDPIAPTHSFRTAASRRVPSATVKYPAPKAQRGIQLEIQPAQFPSPRPVTQEEKLLVQYVRVTPTPVLSASLTDSTTIPDLEIKPLNISPLEDEGTETQDK